MSNQVWGQLYVGSTAPNAGPIIVGTLWSDTSAKVLKRCTSLSPITFVSVEGGSAAHDLFSATHGDVDEADTPGDGQILKYNSAAGKWRAEDEAGEAHRLGAPSTLTISSGRVTVTGRYHLIDTEGAAASDELAGMAGGSDGDIVVIRPANDARTVVVKHEGTEAATASERFNLPGDADITLDDLDDMLPVVYDGTIGRWIVLETFGKRHGDLGGVGANDHHNEDHATRHHSGGADALALGSIAGELTNAQHGSRTQANAHAHSHLSGVGTDDHHAQDHASRHAPGGGDVPSILDPSSELRAPRKTDPTTPSVGEIWINGTDAKYRDNQATPATQRLMRAGEAAGGDLGGTYPNPTINTTHAGSAHHDQDHAARHHSGGADALALGSIAGELTDAQHGSRTQANAHAHSHLSGVGENDHHDKSHLHTTASGSGALQYLKSITVESPTGTENITFFFTDKAITIVQVNDVKRGGTSVTWNIRHATTRNSGTPNNLFASNRVTDSESGAETTDFTNGDPTIPAGSWVWLITSAVSGTVAELAVTVHYTED